MFRTPRRRRAESRKCVSAPRYRCVVVGGEIECDIVFPLSASNEVQAIVLEYDRTRGAENLQAIAQRRRMTVRHEVADEGHRPAGGGRHEHRRTVLAAHQPARASNCGAVKRQRPEQKAERVHVMDEHLHDEQPLERGEHRLAVDRRRAPGRLGDQSGCERRHRHRADLTDASVPQPSGDAPVVGPKAPVLVDHQTHAATDLRDQ